MSSESPGGAVAKKPKHRRSLNCGPEIGRDGFWGKWKLPFVCGGLVEPVGGFNNYSEDTTV